MGNLGLAINANNAIPSTSELAQLGIGPSDLLRTPVQGSIYMLDRLADIVPAGIKLFFDLNNECDEVRGDWSGWEATCRIVAQRYANLVVCMGCGNELDLWHYTPPVGSPDPRLTPEFAASLVRRASPILRAAGIKVATSGVASPYWVDYLGEMVARCRNEADYANLHLYVKSAGGIPGNPDWQTVNAAHEQALSVSMGLPVVCSEAGIKVDDAGGLDRQAQWITNMFHWASNVPLDKLPACVLFAWRDDIGTPQEQLGQAFGLRDPKGNQKPAWFAAQRAFGGPITNDVPIYQLGFKEWHNADPLLLGDPMENERGGVPGFSVQKTKRGRLMAQYLAVPETNAVRGWTLTYWDDATGFRYLYQNGRSVRIA